MNIHQSAEDYLETIYMLMKEKNYVRSIDIAHHLNVSKPSVSVAMKRLRENNYIHMDEDNLITLTPAGEKIALSIYGRHKTLTTLFMRLGVDEKTASDDACKIEHHLSEETYQAILKHTLGR